MRENYLGLSVDQQNDRPDRRSGSSVIVEWCVSYEERVWCLCVCRWVVRGMVTSHVHGKRYQKPAGQWLSTLNNLVLQASRGLYEHRRGIRGNSFRLAMIVVCLLVCLGETVVWNLRVFPDASFRAILLFFKRISCWWAQILSPSERTHQSRVDGREIWSSRNRYWYSNFCSGNP